MQTAKLVTFRLIFKWTSHCAVIKEEQVCRDMLNECESSPREGINRRGIVVYSEQSKAAGGTRQQEQHSKGNGIELSTPKMQSLRCFLDVVIELAHS